MSAATNHYVPPKGRIELRMNGAVAWLTRHGVSLFGSRILRVRGRSSGLWREVPVNPLTLDGGRYLVAPRGHTQWVRNLRVSGEGQLRLGRRVQGFTAVEIADDEKVAVLREYLRRWKFEVGMFFDGVDAKASDEELLRIAPKHPVFRITSA
ncbi:MAG TPA: nitroreductase/quinone reductase family protein [Actinomycetales bacterium]|nr:nitroreductase/quinone reductase family protein [Actinomycetales bacterium]